MWEDGDAHEDGDVPYDVNDDSGRDICNDNHIPDLLTHDDRDMLY